MSKNALRYPESAIAGGVFGTARVRGMVADTAARLAAPPGTARCGDRATDRRRAGARTDVATANAGARPAAGRTHE